MLAENSPTSATLLSPPDTAPDGAPPAEALLRFRSDLERHLARVSQRVERALPNDPPEIAEVCATLQRYRGKMLRPALLLTFAAFGNDDRPPSTDAITLAAVCEMVHLATLVHDDVLDDADTRRGSPALNRLHGNEAAVLLGDLLFSAAYRLCASIGDARFAEMLGDVATELCTGELLQLLHRGNHQLARAAYEQIIDRKTASLIGLACRFGAIAASLDPALIDLAERIGRALGRAFQVQDDILDIAGRPDVVGKSLHLDAALGKLTLPLIIHLNTAHPSERASLRSLLDEFAANPSHAQQHAHNIELVRILRASGSLQAAQDASAQLVHQALTLIDQFPMVPARLQLRYLAGQLVGRTR